MGAARTVAGTTIMLVLAGIAFAQSAIAGTEVQEMRVLPIQETPGYGYAEIRGVGAGPFDPALWQSNQLHWVPDVRSPLLAPLPGDYRNIYAPSAVELDDGWRLFYGAWDGTPTGNDRIYSVTTRDLLTFRDRHTVIEHGKFVHVCNVNALRLPDGSFSMVCTAYPDANGCNKPAFFHSPDGRRWNGTPAPYTGTADDIVTIEGYPGYREADINGMNVILHEDGRYRLYFGNFKDFGKTYRATSAHGKLYAFEGKVLDGGYAVNDVKKFRVGDENWYLMALHMNCDKLWYSVSTDGLRFPEAKLLAAKLGEADRYIVAIGWVVSGDQEKPGRRLLGFLYGAGHDAGLASNRIFARWLQRRLVFVADDGTPYPGSHALGPDRQLLPLPTGKRVAGKLEIYAEDGRTLISTIHGLALEAGRCYEIASGDG